MPHSSMPAPEPAEFSVEDAMLNTWVEETGEYLRIDTPEVDRPVEPAEDSA